MKQKSLLKKLTAVSMAAVMFGGCAVTLFNHTDIGIVADAASSNVAESSSVLPYAVFNLNSNLKSKSYMSSTDNGYMRVSYVSGKIGIEYYDSNFNIQSRKDLNMELPIWGGFYKGKDAYYIIEGQNNLEQSDDVEFMRVIKYDFNWNRIKAASISTNSGNKNLFGNEVRFPFDYGCVNAVETDDMLYVVTGHEGYVDDEYNQGHQGFLMLGVDKSAMTGKIADCDLWHSFAQYIKRKDSDLYVLEQSEGSRNTKLTKYPGQMSYEYGGFYADSTSIPVLEYGGDRDSAWAIACYASVDDMELSSDNVLCIGTSIDQSQYENVTSDTPHNIYLTVTPLNNFTQEATKVKWLTQFTGEGKSFVGVKLTKVNDSRFMVSWEEYEREYNTSFAEAEDLMSNHTLHYIFIDGKGDPISKEYTAVAAFSDCHPILKGNKIVYSASTSNSVDFYSIDVNTGKLDKKIYYVAGDNIVWNLENGVLTFSGNGTFTSNAEYQSQYPVSSASTWYSFSSGNNDWLPLRNSVEKIVIKGGIENIPDNMFSNFDKTKEVIIESGLKTIGKNVLDEIDGKFDIYIPDTVTKIGDEAFFSGWYTYSDKKIYYAVIHGKSGSAAEKYANEVDAKFVAVDNVINNSTLSSASVDAGSPVTVTGKASGGTGSYLYSFYYKEKSQTNWTSIGTPYSGAVSASFTPSSGGTYDVRVKVKDSLGSNAVKDFKVTVKGNKPLVNDSVISKTSIFVNKSVAMSAAGSGGTLPYKYAYYYKKSGDSSWTKIGGTSTSAYSTAATGSFTPKTAGTYSLRINVKDNTGKLAVKEFTLTVKADAELKNNSSISATSTTVNNAVTLSGKASGGTSPYKYAYYYKKSGDSSWTKIGGTSTSAYTTAATGTFTPKTAGTYSLRVNVKDNSGKLSVKEFTLTVRSSAELKNNSSISTTSTKVNKAVTLSGKASGGTSPYKYAYYYKKSTDSSWTKAYVTSSCSAYTKYDSITFTPTTVGTYNVRINVKDNNGTGTAVTKDLTLTVK